jgi:branched-subunit amino acid aminotransferase/4-amino-4-deoxychorismate lyase
MKIIFNGQLVSTEDPAVRVSPFSHAVQFGHSVFETFRTTNGHLPGNLTSHWERLFASASIIKLALPSSLTQSSLDKASLLLLSDLDLTKDYRFKVLACADWWWIKAEALVPLPAAVYEQGVEVDEAVQARLFPAAKMASPIYPFYRAHQAETGVFETLFFSPEGYLLEGNVSSVIAVINGELVSPAGEVLPGTTVRRMFEQAQRKGFVSLFRPITREELTTATEIWVVNAIKGIVPVSTWGSWQRSGTKVYDRLKAAVLS